MRLISYALDAYYKKKKKGSPKELIQNLWTLQLDHGYKRGSEMRERADGIVAMRLTKRIIECMYLFSLVAE